MTRDEAVELVLPLVEERLVVGRRVRETGRVRVSIRNASDTRLVDTTATDRVVEVERVPVGREVAEAPPVREEGRTLIIPVLEEVVVTTRRLMLKEEVRLTFAERPRHGAETVVVRRQEAVIERLPGTPPPQMDQPYSQDTHTMKQTITALFDDRPSAERVVEMLVQQHHFDRSAIDVHATGTQNAGSATDMPTGTTTTKETGFFAGLRDLFLPDEDRVAFEEGVRRGGILVVVRAEENQADDVMEALERNGAVDLDTREEEWRQSGWTGGAGMAAPVTPAMGAAAMGASSMATSGMAESQTPMTSPSAASMGTTGAMAARTLGAADDEERIALVEERLKVGKRVASGGRVRVRSYVIETPVSEQVTLREEHVDVQRRSVDRPIGVDEALFQERVIEATESVEEAVVGKEARVREEVVIRKTAEEHVETISDTVRSTDVEIERDGGVVREGGLATERTTTPTPR